MGWKPFEFGSVDLLTFDERVTSGTGVVYSTDPRLALDIEGETYFIKGPDRETTFAELAGCVLANAVSLSVPCPKACRFSTEVFAGTRMISNIRAIEPYVRHRSRVGNYDEVFDAIVVDTWLANADRNMGNIVGSQEDEKRIQFVFIDFEKSAALRSLPIINSTMARPGSLWPSGQLGSMLLNHKPLVVPMGIVNRIGELNEEACNLLIQPVSEALGNL